MALVVCPSCERRVSDQVLKGKCSGCGGSLSSGQKINLDELIKAGSENIEKPVNSRSQELSYIPQQRQNISRPNLMPCVECGRQISKRSHACIHCGCPVGNTAQTYQPQFDTVLIRCSECRREVSDRVSVCPYCGNPISSNTYTQNRSTAFKQSRNEDIYSNTANNYAIASPAKRLVAFLVDYAFQLIPTWLIFSMVDLEEQRRILSSLWFIIFSVVAIIFWTKSASLGRMIMSLRVVNKNTGVKLGFGYMLFRDMIGRNISIFVLLLGVVWLLFDEHKQGWHDKMVSSVVIETLKYPK